MVYKIRQNFIKYKRVQNKKESPYILLLITLSPTINMYRPNHHNSIGIQNCIVLENRLPLVYVPKNFTYYFINSKRRFFLYMKHKQELEQLTRILSHEQVKFYQRKSIFPDRQQNEEIGYHSNFKFKKRDLRRNLKFGTQLREPRTFFEGPAIVLEKIAPVQQSQKVQIKDKYQNDKIIEERNIKVMEILAQKPRQVTIEQQETQPQYLADFGEIKIKSQAVLDIINNIQLIKALFKAEKIK